MTIPCRVIFISNLDPRTERNANFQAVMTRVMNILVGGTKEEIRDRMIDLLPEIAAKLPKKAQAEIAEFVGENYKKINLSLRFIVHLVSLYQWDNKEWKDLAWSIKG